MQKTTVAAALGGAVVVPPLVRSSFWSHPLRKRKR